MSFLESNINVNMDLNFWPSFMLVVDIIQPDLQLSRPYSRPAVFIQIRQCQHKWLNLLKFKANYKKNSQPESACE